MRILVTGAHGFLARSLLAQHEGVTWEACGRSPEAVAGAPYHQVDVGDPPAVASLLEQVRPDWVINTAALTDVDQCEAEPELAQRVNHDVVAQLAEACRRADAGLVHISTDYVFDGEAGPYSEHDTPNPLSQYGRIKLASEEAVLGALDRVIVVRTLWLYGYEPEVGPNFVTWALKALQAANPIRVFDDQWGNPTYVRDLARVLVELCRRETCGLLHMGGATYMTRYELVLELARFFGLSAGSVRPTSTRDVGLRAPRPLRSGLTTTALQTVLERRPMSFVEGLQDLRRDAAFRRDFRHLI